MWNDILESAAEKMVDVKRAIYHTILDDADILTSEFHMTFVGINKRNIHGNQQEVTTLSEGLSSAQIIEAQNFLHENLAKIGNSFSIALGKFVPADDRSKFFVFLDAVKSVHTATDNDPTFLTEWKALEEGLLYYELDNKFTHCTEYPDFCKSIDLDKKKQYLKEWAAKQQPAKKTMKKASGKEDLNKLQEHLFYIYTGGGHNKFSEYTIKRSGTKFEVYENTDLDHICEGNSNSLSIFQAQTELNQILSALGNDAARKALGLTTVSTKEYQERLMHGLYDWVQKKSGSTPDTYEDLDYEMEEEFLAVPTHRRKELFDSWKAKQMPKATVSVSKENLIRKNVQSELIRVGQYKSNFSLKKDSDGDLKWVELHENNSRQCVFKPLNGEELSDEEFRATARILKEEQNKLLAVTSKEKYLRQLAYLWFDSFDSPKGKLESVEAGISSSCFKIRYSNNAESFVYHLKGFNGVTKPLVKLNNYLKEWKLMKSGKASTKPAPKKEFVLSKKVEGVLRDTVKLLIASYAEFGEKPLTLEEDEEGDKDWIQVFKDGRFHNLQQLDPVTYLKKEEFKALQRILKEEQDKLVKSYSTKEAFNKAIAFLFFDIHSESLKNLTSVKKGSYTYTFQITNKTSSLTKRCHAIYSPHETSGEKAMKAFFKQWKQSKKLPAKIPTTKPAKGESSSIMEQFVNWLNANSNNGKEFLASVSSTKEGTYIDAIGEAIRIPTQFENLALSEILDEVISVVEAKQNASPAKNVRPAKVEAPKWVPLAIKDEFKQKSSVDPKENIPSFSAFKAFIEQGKKDTKESAYASATTLSTNLLKSVALSMMEESDSSIVEFMETFLDSELGTSILQLILGYGLTYSDLATNEHAKKFVEKMREKGMETAFTELGTVSMNIVEPTIAKVLSILPNEKGDIDLAAVSKLAKANMRVAPVKADIHEDEMEEEQESKLAAKRNRS